MPPDKHRTPCKTHVIAKPVTDVTGCGNPFPLDFVQGYYGCPCCGAQNFCAALRRTLEILTAATCSLRFLCHWQRSVRSPHRPAPCTTCNPPYGRPLRSPARTRTAFLIMCHCEASAHTGRGNPSSKAPLGKEARHCRAGCPQPAVRYPLRHRGGVRARRPTHDLKIGATGPM